MKIGILKLYFTLVLVGMLFFMTAPIKTTAVAEYIVEGYVYEEEDEERSPLEDVEIKIINIDTGEYTTVETDVDGYYSYDVTNFGMGVNVGHTIRRIVSDMMICDGEFFTDTEVLEGISSDREDFIEQIDDETGTQFDTFWTWELTGESEFVWTDITLETDSNGEVTFKGYYFYKDETTGSRTVYWDLAIYLQDDGIWTSWNPTYYDRTLIASNGEDWEYTAPTNGWIGLTPTLSLDYEPDPGENMVYMQVYSALSVSDSQENANAIYWNIPVIVN
jgi:hypothetical protein